jgi:pyruvate dehydrogenase E1 component alpha subunit
LSGIGARERFRAMLDMRHFDEACLEGVPTREIHGELHTGIGQEAIAAGMMGILRESDALVSTHRNHYHAIAKGVPPRPMLGEIFEKKTGLCRGRGGHMHLFDPERNFSTTGIVGASLPIALGYAYGFWLEGTDDVAVAVTGDGGANTGAFHECLNIAGAWKLPFVVLVENNEYAISVQMSGVSATRTIAERAPAYAAWSRRVDGTDPESVHEAFREGVERARKGEGPVIVEATCYRFRGHFEGDLDLYRDGAEQERVRREYDPLVIVRRKLVEQGVATDEELDTIVEESRREAWARLAEVREEPMPNPSGALEYVYLMGKDGW